MPSAKLRATRTLRHSPDLDQLKRQAKELLQAFAAGAPDAVAEVNVHYPGANPAGFALHDAQLVLARSYGFDSWPKLKAFVDGVTVRSLCEAVRAGDMDRVKAMLVVRPELVHRDVAEDDESRALHYAVLHRRPEIARLLMQYGADAHRGIWPHRDAMTPLTMATERGYGEIVSILRNHAHRHSPVSATAANTPTPAPEASERGGAERTDRGAITAGNADWLRARQRDGALTGQHGLVTHAVRAERPDMLALLLDLGLDPDERTRVDGLEEVVPSWGEPLRQCAIAGQLAMAEILLKHGASANTHVYAGSSAMYEAYARQNRAMVDLLERHGGFVDAGTIGYLGLANRLERMFEEEAAGRLPEGLVSPGRTVAEDLLNSAAGSGNVDLVRTALEHLDWARGDTHWYWTLLQPFGRHPDAERARYLRCFQLVLERSGVDLPHKFGRTLLHDVAGAWPRSAPMGAAERIGFATLLLDAGARLDVRDDLLESTPLGWACRWGRVELVSLLLERSADPLELEAEPWATPLAWAEKMDRGAVLSVLRQHGQHPA